MTPRTDTPQTGSSTPVERLEEIPACPDCAGDGCGFCLGTGLAGEDCNLAGLARGLGRERYFEDTAGRLATRRMAG